MAVDITAVPTDAGKRHVTHNVANVAAWMSAFVVCFIGATCTREPAAPLFALRQIGPKTWAAIDDPTATRRSGANAGFVIGDDAVLVIDTFDNVDAAKQLLAHIHSLTNLPIRFAINTHHHPDHVGGNGVFAQAGAVVLAHRNVRRWIHTENLRSATEGMRSIGSEITPEQRAVIEGLVPPTLVYDRAVDLYLGAREVQVRSFPGHTGGDSIVLIPDAKVVFCGDLLWRDILPTLNDASTEPWVETLQTLATSEPGATFVPGHGDLSHARDVTALWSYLMTLRNLVATAQAQGKSGDALANAVIPMLAEQYGQWRFFKEMVKPNVLQTDAELRGTKRIPHAEPGT